MVREYDNIVILTGAGVSAESGLGTFRGSGGLWENFRIEDVATPEGFARNPVRVHEFYNLRRSWMPCTKRPAPGT
jgi:NAD-dependent deacetylase